MKKNLLITALFGLLFSMSAQAQGGCGAYYQYSMANCPTVSFTDMSVPSSPNFPLIAWYYDFGDGTNSTMQNPTHTYTANGGYQISLTVIGADSCVSVYSDSIFINCIQGGSSCSANFYYSDSLCPQVDFFDASASNVGIANWYWTFGDGGVAATQYPSHTYSGNGQYLVCLTIVASDSCVDTYCDTISISCIADLQEFDDLEVILAPNPANDIIQLTLKNAGNLNYRVLDLKGQSLLEGVNKESVKHTIRIDQLPSGIYLLDMTSGENRSVKKFIKR